MISSEEEGFKFDLLKTESPLVLPRIEIWWTQSSKESFKPN